MRSLTPLILSAVLLLVGWTTAQYSFGRCRGSCCDSHRFCRNWAAQRECVANPKWMLSNCKLSCGACQGQTPQPTVAPAPLQPSRDQPQPAPLLTGCPVVVPFEAPVRSVPTVAELNTDQLSRGCATVSPPSNCTTNLCFNLKYRTIDGSCNNFQQPLWAAAQAPYTRLLPPNFDDGIGALVGSQRRRLPSPRDISRMLMSSPINTNDLRASTFDMEYGQFLAHDFTRNAVNEICDCDSTDARCANIVTPPNDPKRQTMKCLKFTRSTPVCGTGVSGVPREFYNENTGFIDGSQIYGSEPKTQSQLRQGAFLRSERVGGLVFPPHDDTTVDVGDDRASLFTGLVALQTAFLRLHNSIAGNLQSLNPTWNPDRVYQETRKIISSAIQVIAYQEYLPVFLGNLHDRLMGSYAGYKPEVNAGILLEFTTASYRLHGLLQETYPLLDAQFRQVGQVRLIDSIFNIGRIINSQGIDGLMRGFIATPIRTPQTISRTMTELLFGGENDIVSTNVQRGRDVGLRPYNDYRRICNLAPVTDFNNWPEVSDAARRQRVAQLYQSPDDIDLYVGGLLEDPIGTAVFGPTISCIVAEQFKRLRDGDRFYFENPAIFSPAQLSELKKITLSWVLCAGGDNMQRITPTAFHIDNGTNAVPCESLPRPDLRAWIE